MSAANTRSKSGVKCQIKHRRREVSTLAQQALGVWVSNPVGTSKRLNAEEQTLGIFHAILHRHQEVNRLFTVNDTMVIG